MEDDRKNVLDVLVIGCGPTGIAALAESKMNGLKALGIEVGESALSNILQYPDEIVFSSPAFHFQINDLPLDCKNPNELSKEELLFYYSRIINHYNLRMNCRSEFVGISKSSKYLEISYLKDRKLYKVKTKNVIFTAWYANKEIKLDGLHKTDIEVLNHFQNPIKFVGKKNVIIGGGISGWEAAVAMMMAGQKIVLLIRSKTSAIHNNSQFIKLLEITKSEVFTNVSKIKLNKKSISFLSDRKPVVMFCDNIIVRTGQELNFQLLKILLDFGIIDEKLLDKLGKAESFDAVIRKANIDIHPGKLLIETAEHWPDFYEHFAHGIKNVFFAGSILHVGGSSAGIKTSIFTALAVVRTISGKGDDLKIASPLPVFLKKITESYKSEVNLASIIPIRPYPVNSWKRGMLSLKLTEDSFGQLKERDKLKYYLGGPEDNLMESIISLSNGQNTLGEIIAQISSKENNTATIINKLYFLFYNNGLTWFPSDCIGNN